MRIARRIALLLVVLVAWLGVGAGATPPAQTQDPDPGAAPEWEITQVAHLDLRPRSAWSFAVEPPFAYVVTPGGQGDEESGLVVLDLTQPAEPREIGSVQAPISGASVTTARGFVYGRDLSGTGVVIDVRDPAQPRHIGPIGRRGGGQIHALATDGIHLFAAVRREEGSSLAVFDLSEPDQPQPVGEVLVAEVIRGFAMATHGGFVFLPTLTGVSVVDVRDPVRPRAHDSIGLGVTFAVLMAGSWLLAAIGEVGEGCSGCWRAEASLRVLSIGGGHPLEVGRLPLAMGATDMALVGPMLLVRGDGWIDAVDISDPFRPRRVAHDARNYRGLWLEAMGDVAVAHADEGLSVLRVDRKAVCPETAAETAGSPTGIRQAGVRLYLPLVSRGPDTCRSTVPKATTALVGGLPRGAVAVDGHAFMGRGTRVQVYDIAGGRPKPVGTSPLLAGNVTALALAGRTLYVGDEAGAVTALDIAQPAAPRFLGRWRPLLPIVALAVPVRDEPGDAVPDRLYVADASTITVLDIREPGNLQPIGRIDTATGASVLAARGDLLVAMVAQVGSVRIFDVSDPAQARYLGQSDYATADTLALGDGVAYVADEREGIKVVELADPSRTPSVWPGPDGRQAISLALEGTRLYGVLADGQVTVMDVSEPRQLHRLATVPAEIPRAKPILDSVGALAVWQGWVLLSGVGSTPGSVRMVDARLSGSPAAATAWDDLGSADQIVRSGHNALVADGETVWLVDLVNPDAPLLRSKLPLPGRVTALALDGAHGYVAWSRSEFTGSQFVYDYGLTCLNLATVSDPLAAASLKLDGSLRALVARGP